MTESADRGTDQSGGARWLIGLLVAVIAVVLAYAAWQYPKYPKSPTGSGPATESSEQTSSPPSPEQRRGNSPVTTAKPPRLAPRWYPAIPQVVGSPYAVELDKPAIVDARTYADAISLPLNEYFDSATVEFAIGRQCMTFKATFAFSDFTSRDAGVVWSIRTEKAGVWTGQQKFGDSPISKSLSIAGASRLVLVAKFFPTGTYVDDSEPGPVVLTPQLLCSVAPPVQSDG